MKLLCSGPVHKEAMTLPYCWVLRFDEGKFEPYVIHRKVMNPNSKGETVSVSYTDGYYFGKDEGHKAMLKWLSLVSESIHYNVSGMSVRPFNEKEMRATVYHKMTPEQRQELANLLNSLL